MANTKTKGRGRPITHELTAVQRRSVEKRLQKGQKPAQIIQALGGDIHPYAVLRVKRSLA